MDLATIIGVLLAFGALFGMVSMEHVEISGLIIPAPMVLVFGATLACGLAGTTLKDAIANLKAIPTAFTGKVVPPASVIEDVVGLAETARTNGLLSLEQEADKHDDPFLKKALQNIADGTDGEELRILLEDEIESNASTLRNASKFFMGLGGYAPTVGIIGTVVSLTHVLANLSKPDELGPLIASAFVATLWGLLSANFLWLPIGGKLKKLADLEVARQTLLMEGLLAVQAGSQPRLLGERLRAMVPPSARGDAAPAKGPKGKGKGAADDEALAA
ncbi:MotA/TolQ/ExbB proton channel family protein [Curtobacterium sp. MCBD17_003]|uniref:motility protein A n=1 Tax=Curtobacterium sp. MCBD17_003 TaxID=2175667 RepID=UPI000DA78834|nr:MotA/TolQ/ExbB proton channel family protein [Curtobacterium sp. MCBD17_003]WIE56047.1 MotA/TolQ/ExbB proton channel family protein [Curtobacterium sp. MCBD17_003]